LKPVQKKIYNSILNSKELIYVVNCSRRIGKSTTVALIAVETALRNINYQIHYGAPYQNALKDFLLPIFNQILSDCPSDIRPIWKQQEGKFIFKNGSYIKLCGANNGQFENLRGNKSDLFILDEAAKIDDLDTVIKDVALPQLLSSTNEDRRIILPSTPPNTPDHPFKLYAEKAKGRGAYSEFTLDESWYGKDLIERWIREMGGRESTSCMREYFCKFVTDSTLQIVPEWDSAKFVKEIEKDDYFQFYTVVEGMDIGYRDFTAWIMGYYDFLGARLVIEHEIALRENDFTTENLAKLIKSSEETYNKDNQTRFRRISDNNNLNILADLGRIYKLPFGPVNKKNGKTWMVNQLRQFIKAGKLFIHPRCKMLISSLEFGIWRKNLEEFERSADLGHYDFVDALVYLIAVLVPTIQNLNPIPPLYKINLATTMFPNGMPRNTVNPMDEEVMKIFPKLY
jgi:hypothetical protein